MKWMLPLGFAIALAIAILLVVSRGPSPGASGPADKDRDRRRDVPDRGAWRTYHGNFALDGLADEPLPDAPELLWKFKAGNRVDLTPVSAAGRIYFTTAKGGLVALDLDGKPVWTVSIAPDSFSSPLLLVDGLLIAGSSKGILHAFETGAGKEKWGYDPGGAIQGSPNRIGFPGGRRGVMAISPSDGAIHGVDLETGTVVWKTAGVERCDGSAALSGGRIVMGSCASALHVFSEPSGEKLMDVPLGGDNQVAGGVAMSGTTDGRT